MSDDKAHRKVDMEAVRKELACNARVFEAIGRFIFQFSQLEFTIRVFLAAQLKLSDEHFDAVTGPYDFRMLCTVAKEISLLRFPEQKKDIESLFSRCLSLNDNRVRVAHGLCSGGIGGGMTARHVARSSLKASHYFEKPEDVAKLADIAQSLMAEVLFVLGVPPEAKADADTSA